MKEKTLKIEIAAPPKNPSTCSNPKRNEWRRKWHKALAVPLLASLASAIFVGKKVEPNFPREALLPKSSTSTENPEKKRVQRKIKTPTPKNLLIRCRMELQKPRRSLSMLENFPSCQHAFLSDLTCSELARDYSEILYLQAYALAISMPADARQLLLRASGVLANCPTHLPLRKRAIELLRKLEEGFVAKKGSG